MFWSGPSIVKPLGFFIWIACCVGQAFADTYRWDNVERVVVVPDVHGAYPALVELLQTTNVIDADERWSGGEAHLVSLGDLLDRGPQSRQVMDLFMRLQLEAHQAGGRVHVVAGNHELMNLIGDLRYVADAEFAAFSADETDAMRAEAPDPDRSYPPGYFAHRKAFKADGYYGRWLLTLPAVIVVNDTAYAHGGLPPVAARLSLTELNQQYRETVSNYLSLWAELITDGVLPDDQDKDAGVLARSALANAEQSPCLKERAAECLNAEHTSRLKRFVSLSESSLLNDEGPLWYRGAVYCRPLFERPSLEAALANTGAARLVVGHTTTPDARVHSLHNNQMVLMDTGMLVAYYKGRPAALVIESDKEFVQFLSPAERAELVRDDYPFSYGLSLSELHSAAQSGDVTVVEQYRDERPWKVSLAYKNTSVDAVFFPGRKATTANRELAAYRLSQLMGLDLVPVTTSRVVDGTEGALQLAYNNTLTEAQRVQDGKRLGGWCSMDRQFDLMRVWDLLIANRGRTVENVSYQLPLWRLHLGDHAGAFGKDRRLPGKIKDHQLLLHPQVRAALSKLTGDGLQENLGELIGKKNVDALLKRRDLLLKSL